MRIKVFIIFIFITYVNSQSQPQSHRSSHPYEFVRSLNVKRTSSPGETNRAQLNAAHFNARSRVGLVNRSPLKKLAKKDGVPPYAVLMEPLVQYSQPDPLYSNGKHHSSEAKASSDVSSNDLIKKSTIVFDAKERTDEVTARSDSEESKEVDKIKVADSEAQATNDEPYYQDSYHYHHHSQHHEEPEPIIEIIIRESNETLPAPPPLPVPPKKKKKEPVQVFYVKYKNDPSAHYGEEKVIYEAPIPAVTPPTNNEDDHGDEEDHDAPYPDHIATPPPSPPSTTLKAIIRPDSETYHGSGLHITFGEPKENDHHGSYGHGEYEQQSAPQPSVLYPLKNIAQESAQKSSTLLPTATTTKITITTTSRPIQHQQLVASASAQQPIKRNPLPFQISNGPALQSNQHLQTKPQILLPQAFQHQKQSPPFPSLPFRQSPPHPLQRQSLNRPPNNFQPRQTYHTLPQSSPFPSRPPQSQQQQQQHSHLHPAGFNRPLGFSPQQQQQPFVHQQRPFNQQPSPSHLPPGQHYHTINLPPRPSPPLNNPSFPGFRQSPPSVPPYQTIKNPTPVQGPPNQSSQSHQQHQFQPNPQPHHQNILPPIPHHQGPPFSQHPQSQQSQTSHQNHQSQHPLHPSHQSQHQHSLHSSHQPQQQQQQNPLHQSHQSQQYQPQSSNQPPLHQSHQSQQHQPQSSNQPPLHQQYHSFPPLIHNSFQSNSPLQPPQGGQQPQPPFRPFANLPKLPRPSESPAQSQQQHSQQIEQLNRLQQQQQRLEAQLSQLKQQQIQDYAPVTGPHASTEIVKSVDQSEEISLNSFQQPTVTYRKPHTTQTPSTERYLASTSPRSQTSNRLYYSSTASSTVETTTEEVKIDEEEKRKQAKQKANEQALPDEVPDDLRQQLLSSGILGNADIQILDYDKIGDIPIESLPPEALANFQSVAGSEPVPAVVPYEEETIPSASESRNIAVASQSFDPMEMKIVRYNPSSVEGASVADRYVRQDATRLDPVVLNDSKYNRYLPLKVSGAQFPVPDVPELRGRNVTSVVVLAPVDYEFLQRKEYDEDRDGEDESDRISRSAEPALEVQGVHFIAGDILKTLVRMPTAENYRTWLEREKQTTPDKQSVVLLVLDSEDPHNVGGKEIFMYDVSTQRVSKLKGELSSTFVKVAESNSNNRDLDDISDPGGDFTVNSASTISEQNVESEKMPRIVVTSGYRKSN